MDPVSGVLGIASATVTLGALALKIGQTLRTIASAHKQGATLIYSLIGACQAIELAWNRIDTWIRSQPPAAYASDSSFYDRLATSIEGGKIVLDALEQDLGIDAKLSPGQTSAQITWRALLNENTLRDHCTRLNLQLQCLHLLLATASLPLPQARNVLCDCLKPIFRKDEESAWTIVASGARSSLHAASSMSAGIKDDNESLSSVKQFSFTNDLLTAPVYKRLTLNMLGHQRRVQNPTDVLPSSATVRIPYLAAQHMKPTVPSIQGSTITISAEQPVGSRSGGRSVVDEPDVLHLIGHAAGETFSPSTVSDLKRLGSDPANQYMWLQAGLRCPRYLPLQSTLERERKTSEEQYSLDIQLVQATRGSSLSDIALLLDHGANINALSPVSGNTPLQIAINTHQDEISVLFLLQYKNVNIYVRDGRGRTLLHGAVRTRKIQTIQSLLVLGLSMTEEDQNGITPFNIAVQHCGDSSPLLALLLHASMQAANVDEIPQIDPYALHRVCQETPIRLGHALTLLEYGWSPSERFRTAGHTEEMSPLYLAVLKKKTELVERMLLLPSDVVRVNQKHGPCQSLLALAMDGESGSNTIVLLLLQAGLRTQNLWTNSITPHHGTLLSAVF